MILQMLLFEFSTKNFKIKGTVVGNIYLVNTTKSDKVLFYISYPYIQ